MMINITPRFVVSTIVIPGNPTPWNNDWVVQYKRVHKLAIPQIRINRARNLTVIEPHLERNRCLSPDRTPFAQDLTD